MPRRKTVSKKRTNKTAHRRAAEDPEVQVLIRALRRDWEKIDPGIRGERLRQLVERGCSTRGLGEALGKSATSIRKYMTIAALPEKERAAIRNGASAKKILAGKAQGDRLLKMRERVVLDMRSGELSDRLADMIIAFCLSVDGVPQGRILEGEFETFLNSLRQALKISDLRPVKLSKRLTLRLRFLRTRPRVEGDDPLFMPYRADWLATLLLSEAPEPTIRERAIEKAGKRSKELRIEKPALEVWNEKIQRNAQISAGPPRRPVYPGGARAHMKRQGQGVPKGPRDL